MSKTKISNTLLYKLIFEEGKTVPDICDEYHVHPSGLYRRLAKIAKKANKPKDSYLSQPQKSHPGPRTPSVTIQTVNNSCDANRVKELYTKLAESMQEFITTRKGD